MNQPIQPILQMRGVDKAFGRDLVLEGIDLDIRRGEFLTLLGPSGCGKTTLLRLIAGLEAISAGSMRLEGRDLTAIPAEKRPVNTVFQSYALFPHLTVFENVAFGPRLRGIKGSALKGRVQEALETVNLSELAGRRPGQLSGGQQQRVAIARALVNQPLILLLDEPLSALDSKLRKKMQIELKQLQRRLGITFVFVTHDQEEALSMSDRVAVMNAGRIEQLDSPRRVYEDPANLFVARFVGEANLLPARVLGREDAGLTVELEGKSFQTGVPRRFEPQQMVNLLLRPEDLRVWSPAALEQRPELRARALPATVDEVIYKGTTVDLLVRLESGVQVAASAFFDEGDPTLDYQRGDSLFVTWPAGWEVLLPFEAAPLAPEDREPSV